MLFKIEDFQVEFDNFTPRPHLIILNKKFPQNGSLSADQQSQVVACYEQIKQKLKERHPEIDFKRLTLVMHYGCYLSDKTHKFLAHVWMDERPYIALYSKVKNASAAAANTYIQKVVNYPKLVSNKQAKYLSGERREIASLKGSSTTQEQAKATSRGHQLVYHESLPNIGFRIRGAKNLAQTWLEMQEFAKNHGLMEGCHICIEGSPNGPPFPGGEVDGYILCSVKTYYNMLTAEESSGFADAWMRKYGVATTTYPVLS